MTLNGNPNLRRVVKGSENGKYTAEDSAIVSMKGMAWKSVVLCAVTIISAILSAVLLNYFISTDNEDALFTLIMILAFSAIPLIIISFVIMFFPKTAGVLGIIYCVLEGLVMGVISALFDLLLPGIAIMAFIGTCIVFLVSLLVFNLLGQKLSGNFVKFVLISFISIILLEGLGYILSLFVPAFEAVMSNIWVQLAISAVMILWASFMILVDLNNMKRLAESAMLYKYMDEVRPNDDSNREGHAAKVYFNALFGKDFTRSLENSTNAALNYGYGIILSAFNREIVANGYITQLGLFHDNMFNQFNLGSDLMEPFRVLVDCAVKNMMPQKFEHEEKVTVLKILQQEVRIGNRREYVNNAIKIYCRSVFDALNENDALLIKFYENEL